MDRELTHEGEELVGVVAEAVEQVADPALLAAVLPFRFGWWGCDRILCAAPVRGQDPGRVHGLGRFHLPGAVGVEVGEGAITSRPLLLQAVGRIVTTGRRKIICLTSTHALAERVRLTLSRIAQFLNRLAQTEEQFSPDAIWTIILNRPLTKHGSYALAVRSF